MQCNPLQCSSHLASERDTYTSSDYVLGPFYLLLEAIDGRTRVLSYYLAGGLILGSFYWSAVTYGAITVMQVVGHRHGLRTMEQADPLLLLFGLPTIPVCLLLAKTIPWERALRLLWRHHIRRWAIVRWLSNKGK